MFDIHKIKPVHGWRELIGEIGIIVVGVLIALTAEQITETWHWRREAAEARSSLSLELADNVAMIRERELYSRCIARRIRDISAILDTASKTGRLPPVGSIGQPSDRSYELPTWTALTGSGVAARLPRAEVLTYGRLASAGREMTDLNRAEMISWADMFSIVGPGRSTSLEEIGQLRRTVSEINYRAKLMRLWGAAILDNIATYKIPLDHETLAEVKRSWPQEVERINTRSICQALGKPPSSYGEAPFDTYSLEGPMRAN